MLVCNDFQFFSIVSKGVVQFADRLVKYFRFDDLYGFEKISNRLLTDLLTNLLTCMELLRVHFSMMFNRLLTECSHIC